MALFMVLFLDESRSNVGNYYPLALNGERANIAKAIELANAFKADPSKLKEIMPCPPVRLNFGLVLVRDADLESWGRCNTLDKKREWWDDHATKQSLVVTDIINTRKRA